MVNLSILISSSEKLSGPSGLFDFNLTLPLVAIQFVILTLILNVLLYTPLLNIMSERNNTIVSNLSNASEILMKANKLTARYEQELNSIRKASQVEITNSQEIHKEILGTELNISQKSINSLLENTTKEFNLKKETILSNLDNQIKILTTQIEKKLSI